MIPYNFNEGSRHIGVVWSLWYAADSAYALGQLVAIDYSDSTPDVAFTYDRLGRQLTVTDVLGTRTNVYDALNLLAERHPDGTALVRSYDAYGRASGIALGPDYAVGYGYDAFGRFSTVAVSNGPTFTYSYVPNSSLLAGYTNDLGLAVAYEYEPHRDLIARATDNRTAGLQEGHVFPRAAAAGDGRPPTDWHVIVLDINNNMFFLDNASRMA